MTLPIGAAAPDFSLGVDAPDFHAWRAGRWSLIVAVKALSPTCSSEFSELTRLSAALAQAGIAVMAVVCDPAEEVAQWLADLSDSALADVRWPVVDDSRRAIGEAYDVLDASVAMPSLQRAAIVVSPEGKVAMSVTYPVTTGRNFEELIRAIASLQLTARAKVATPADWRPGGRVMLPPSLAQGRAEDLYPDGVDVVRPYLRFVRQPA